MRLKWFILALSVTLLGASLAWDLPTTNQDGSPLTDLAGTRLWCGTQAGGPYGLLADVLVPTTMWGPLPAPPQYCVATAYDTDGLESTYSNEAVYLAQGPPPQVQGVTVQLQPYQGSSVAAIAHAFTEQNTNQTTASTTPVDVTGASIASGNFTAGKKYLLFVTAQMSNNTAGQGLRVKALHGTTDFNGSQQQSEADAANERSCYQWMTVWTAVSGEAIKLQFWVPGSGTGALDQIAMFAMNLSDDLTENTDWVFGDRPTDDALTSAFLDGASITFTPGTAGHDWLVLSYSLVDHGTGTNSSISRLDRSGEAASSLPEARYENINANGMYLLSRVFNLGAASNTFKEQSAISGTDSNFTRLHSSIFALNLNKFRNHASAYTEADASLSATDYATQLQTISLTPAVAGDVLIGGYWGFDRNNTGREAEFRVQVDNSDQPAAQSTDNYQFGYGTDATDEDPYPLITLASLTAAAHTIDLDASADSTAGTPAGQHRSLWAFTMELATAAFSLNAEPGSYTVSGSAAGILATRLLDAQSGSYLLSGADAATLAGYLLNAESGSYALTGADATLLATRLLNAEPGTYTVTGIDAALLAARVLNAEPGTYSISGAAATLLANYMLAADPGSYVVTGVAAELIYTQAGQFVLNAEPGAYLIAGADATLQATRILEAQPGAYAVVGTDATLVIGVAGAAPAGTVPVRYLVGPTANVVPVETVLTSEAGVVPVREFVGPANVVPVRETSTEVPRVKVRKV